MKKFRKASLLLPLMVLFIAFGCKKSTEPPVDPEAEVIAKLVASTWKPAAAAGVTLDGEDRTADFTGFTLTVTSNKTYSVSNVPSLYSSVWPTSGSWDFKSTGSAIPDLTTIIRDGSLEISIDVLTDTQFVFSFTYVTGSIEGTTGIEGNYIFNMVPN